MPSGSRERECLSLLLTALMLLPIILSFANPLSEGESEELSTESSRAFENHAGAYFGDLRVPQLDDPSHGWLYSGGTGEALLRYRLANYVPMQDWQSMTGERVISGWHVLGHDYPIPSDWKDGLGDLGIECQTFFSPQGFHCDVPDLPFGTLMDAEVIGAFRLDPTDKLAPDVLRLLENGGETNAVMEGDQFVINVLLSGVGHERDILAGPFEVKEIYSDRDAKVVTDEKGIEWLAGQHFVEWIEPEYPVTLDNDAASAITNADWSRGGENWQCDVSFVQYGQSDDCDTGTLGLTGSGIIVGVMDTGLDVAQLCSGQINCDADNSGIHPDFYERIVAVENSLACPDQDDDPGDPIGHGTHVAGSVLGDGSAGDSDGNPHAGMAPGASLYMQPFYCPSGGTNYWTPSSYDDIFGPAYDEGARVHTNSWGIGPKHGNYYGSSTSRQADLSAYEYDDMVILYATGNDGYDSEGSCTDYGMCTPNNPDGEVNLGWMNQQARAKNILSIGASEDFRLIRTDIYGQFCNGFPQCGPETEDRYSVEPLYSDKMSWDIGGVAAFSNRGPTEDGRLKPDLVAPGTWVVSTRSFFDKNGDGVIDTNDAGCIGSSLWQNYCYSTGTSMATPITAGTVALILEHLSNQGFTDPYTKSGDPASAMVKALLIAGAYDMEGQYTSGGDGENGAVEAAPNPHEGWGRVDVQGTVESIDGNSFLPGTQITTGESHSIRLSVPAGLSEVRVVLSWNDPPNSPSADLQLVNDLDIFLKDPSGALFDYSNDNVNNLVGIVVDSPDAGDWEVIVVGENVADGSQVYYVASNSGLMTDMRQPISEDLSVPGFQSGSIFTETTMSTGGTHICAIFDDSSLNCWGDNSHGQLGDGTDTDRLTMTPVGLAEGRTAVSVSAGRSHTCAILDNGDLECWGRNNHGQLGDGSSSSSNSPTSVSLSGVPVQISSGDWHTCAILEDASLECWGRNNDGQLGDVSNTPSNTPVSVDFGASKVLSISAGARHTCAILDDWSLKCWGDNTNGQLGIGSTPSSINSPTTVTTGGNVVAVSAGGSHTCVILENSDLKCWGAGEHGQLGYGTTNELHDASSVSVVMGSVTSIDSGEDHTCAINTAGNLHCWGSSSGGQVGDGTTTSSVSSPTEIVIGQLDPHGQEYISDPPFGLGAISVSAGSSYTCVTASNDLPNCWGGHGSGSLSVGTSPSEFEMPRWSYINSAERDLNENGNLNIFEVNVGGDNDGDGFSAASDSDDNNPTVAANCSPGNYGRYACKEATEGYFVSGWGSSVMTPARPGYYVDDVGASSDEPCGIGYFQELSAQTSCDPARPGYYIDTTGQSSGTPCPGGTFNPDTGQTSAAACDGADSGYHVPIITQITSGSYHTCAILDDGSVSCWGNNANGQLGDGTREAHDTPDSVLLPQGKSAVAISAGSYHTCAILEDGSLRCWGSNEFGQLGDGTTIERLAPVNINLGLDRTAAGVSAGESHTCAVLDDYSIKCWGENSNGQLGDGTGTNRLSPVSTDLGDGETAIMVSSGSYHTCAIVENRSVKCWGDNWQGQLGDGTNSDRLSPVLIDLISNSSAIVLSSGPFHTCAGMNDGSMKCWGFNLNGQLGNGHTTNTNSPSSVGLSQAQSPTQVSTGLFHTCSLFDSGGVSCWGGNSVGQIGDGVGSDSPIPLMVSLPAGKGALAISTGQRHSCAILDDATLYCWGYNSEGQLGDGSQTNRLTPVNIDLMHGSGAQIPCSAGTYQPDESQTSCILADRGYSVPLPAWQNQTGCTKGYYTNLRGQATCVPASIGYYVDENLADSQTACPAFNSTLQVASNNLELCKPDFDGDMLPDEIDLDDDDDGVEDRFDFDPLDPEISIDSDGDLIPDSLDDDDDNDGVNDTADLFPLNQMEWKDDDGDGLGDNSDPDDDGDGRDDMFDVFPDDPEEWSDYDADGVGDNADDDDDNDGVLDVDGSDAFPLDSSEWLDTDGDSVGNNADEDDDGDGFDDTVDAFSLDSSEWLDSDGDTFGDNTDWDDNDPTEWMDSDGDQIGDNSDQCPNEQGLNSSFENWAHKLALGNLLGCPLEVIQADEDVEEVKINLADVPVLDSDGDGQIDAFDKDDDDDGICDAAEVVEEVVDDDGKVIVKACSMGPDGKLDPKTGEGKFSKDPTRPFEQNVWLVMVVCVAFVSIMGQRLFNWKKRQLAKLKSKKIRLG